MNTLEQIAKYARNTLAAGAILAGTVVPSYATGSKDIDLVKERLETSEDPLKASTPEFTFEFNRSYAEKTGETVQINLQVYDKKNKHKFIIQDSVWEPYFKLGKIDYLEEFSDLGIPRTTVAFNSGLKCGDEDINMKDGKEKEALRAQLQSIYDMAIKRQADKIRSGK